MLIQVNMQDIKNVLHKEQTSSEFEESRERLEKLMVTDLDGEFHSKKEKYYESKRELNTTIDNIIASSTYMKHDIFFNYVKHIRNDIEENREVNGIYFWGTDLGDNLENTCKFIKTWDWVVDEVVKRAKLDEDSKWIADNSPLTGKEILNKTIVDYDSMIEVMEGDMYSFVGCSSINEELGIRDKVKEMLLS